MHLILRIFLVAACTFSLSVSAAPIKETPKDDEVSVLNPHTSVIGHHEHDEFCIVTDGEARQIKVAEQKKAEELHQETLRLQAEKKAQTRQQIQATELAIQSADDVGAAEITPAMKMGKEREIPGAPKIKSTVKKTLDESDETRLNISQNGHSEGACHGAKFSVKKPQADVGSNTPNHVCVSKKQSAKAAIAKQQTKQSKVAVKPITKKIAKQNPTGAKVAVKKPTTRKVITRKQFFSNKVAVKKSTSKKVVTKKQAFGAKVASKKTTAKKIFAKRQHNGIKVAIKKSSARKIFAKQEHNGIKVAIKKQYAKTKRNHTATTKVARKTNKRNTTVAFQAKAKPQNQFNQLKTIRYSTYEAATTDKKIIYV